MDWFTGEQLFEFIAPHLHEDDLITAPYLSTIDSHWHGVPAIAFIGTTPFFIIGILADSLIVVFFAFLVIQALSFALFGPLLSAFQHIVGPNMRATASAVFLFINNLIGIGIGNLAIGVLSDSLAARFAEESLRYAIASGAIFYVLAALFFILAAPHLKRDWEG